MNGENKVGQRLICAAELYIYQDEKKSPRVYTYYG